MIRESWAVEENPFPTNKQLNYMDYMEDVLTNAGITFAKGGSKCRLDRSTASRRCQYLYKVAEAHGLPGEWERVKEEHYVYKPYSSGIMQGFKKLSARGKV